MTEDPPRKPMRNAKIATFETGQEKPPIILSDEEMRQDYEQAHPEELKRTTSHVVYSSARDKRKYRQAHVMKHWDETDRQILFLLILGDSHKSMEIELGISRQAIEKRLEHMREQVGVQEDTQLLLWILGFVTLYPNGKMTTTGTSLIESHDYRTQFGRRILTSVNLPSLASTKD